MEDNQVIHILKKTKNATYNFIPIGILFKNKNQISYKCHSIDLSNKLIDWLLYECIIIFKCSKCDINLDRLSIALVLNVLNKVARLDPVNSILE